MMDTRTVTGITMGDPSGVGPEIIVKVFREDDIFKICRPVIIGDPQVLAYYIDSSLTLREISSADEAVGQKGTIDVIRISSLDKNDFVPGKPSSAGGRAMVDYILTAVKMTMSGQLSAGTCP
jgi:4-hydroxythreonine-4-phosphate dehydrogenase